MAVCILALACAAPSSLLFAQSVHEVSVAPSASPPEAFSGDTIQLDAGWTDSWGDEPATTGGAGYGWTDGGAGGAFLPSPYVKNPQYATPSVAAGQSLAVTLHCQLTCSVDSTLTASGSVDVDVHGDRDIFSLSMSANPLVIASGGIVRLSLAGSDAWGHGFATWWSDAGVGGTFMPSQPAEAAYTLRNTKGRDVPVVLIATADCGGWVPEYSTASTIVTVQPDPHSFWITADPPQPAVLSGSGTVQLNATLTDWLGHGLASCQWSDGGAGGLFLPSPYVMNPTYTVTAPPAQQTQLIGLSVTATCNGPEPVSDTTSVLLLVSPSAAGSYQAASAGLPVAMAWDQTADASVACRNTGSATWTAGGGYQLVEQDATNRWGVTSVSLNSTVLPGQTYTFILPLTAPPLTTLKYDTSSSPALPMADALDCSWQMTRDGRALDGQAAADAVVVSRFPDIGPGTIGYWAQPYVEQCAGRVPAIVQGFEDGTYRPSVQVDRATMAVYIARAMGLITGPYQGVFRDIRADFWAAPQIEALYDAGVVKGYSNGTYQPAQLVSRASMAAYVARGIAGGDSAVPQASGPPTFPDVPPRNWAYDYIEYLVAQGVVQGYEDGAYRPGWFVARDQMAVYVYRGFIRPSGSAVVLGGPAITVENPDATTYLGWRSVSGSPAGRSLYAYVIFDAMRFGPELVGPDLSNGAWHVRFELRDAANPDTPAMGTSTAISLFGASDLATAKAAALTTGTPYYPVSWSIPEDLALGDYVLVVTVEDSKGKLRELPRRAPLTITP